MKKNMGMISNYTRRSTGVFEKYLKIILAKQLMSFFYRAEIKSHFQPITGYEGVPGKAMSCQPGVVRDPERTLNQDFASISRPASAASPALSRAFLADPELWDRSVDTASSFAQRTWLVRFRPASNLCTPARKRTERFGDGRRASLRSSTGSTRTLRPMFNPCADSPAPSR